MSFMGRLFAASWASVATSSLSAAIAFSVPPYFELVPPNSVFFNVLGAVMLGFAAIDAIRLLFLKN